MSYQSSAVQSGRLGKPFAVNAGGNSHAKLTATEHLTICIASMYNERYVLLPDDRCLPCFKPSFVLSILTLRAQDTFASFMQMLRHLPVGECFPLQARSMSANLLRLGHLVMKTYSSSRSQQLYSVSGRVISKRMSPRRKSSNLLSPPMLINWKP